MSPRMHPSRSTVTEKRVASRIREERANQRLSLQDLADRMDEVGHPVHATAIWRIEKGTPPRRITVDELIGFSAALGVSIESFLAGEAGCDDERCSL